MPAKKPVKKVVLAYSGGLDTSVILKWLQDHYDAEVVTFTADLGQGEELEPARKKAEAAGVKDIILKPSAAAKYLDIAHGEIWKELKNRSEHADKLRALMYFPGKANRQAKLGGLKLRD